MMTLEMSGYEVGSDVLTCNRFVVQMLTNDVYSRSRDIICIECKSTASSANRLEICGLISSADSGTVHVP